MLIFSFFIDHTEKENLKSWSIFTVYSMTHRKNLYLGEEKKIHIWRERETGLLRSNNSKDISSKEKRKVINYIVRSKAPRIFFFSFFLSIN